MSIEVVGEASDGCQAVEAAARLRPDVVLMDICMPTLNGWKPPGSSELLLRGRGGRFGGCRGCRHTRVAARS
jgi:Response regulator receiver domain